MGHRLWHKLSKDVNVICDGDDKKTMRYVFVWLLNIVTLGIFGIVWRALLAKRLKTNAARYGLKFSDSALFTVLLTVLVPFAGLLITKIVLVKNFNKLAVAYNEYNGLVDEDEKKVSIFAD